MRLSLLLLLATVTLTARGAVPPADPPAAPPAAFVALRAADARMATIAFRLVTGNAALCRDLQPATGMLLHAVDQYPRGSLTFAAPVAVEAVVPDSPAAQAGIAADDGLIAVNGQAMPPAGKGMTSATRDAANALLARQPQGAPLILAIDHAGTRRSVTIRPIAGCRSEFEILSGTGLAARSDGRIVQVGYRFFQRFDDAGIAAVVAHELSHTLLRHRARLEAAGVRWGMFGEFGRNARLFRETEADADRLSVHLLRNAGYDPRAAVRLWREHGDEIDGGLFRSQTHPDPAARAAAIEAELATLPPPDRPDDAPAILATRDRPL